MSEKKAEEENTTQKTIAMYVGPIAGVVIGLILHYVAKLELPACYTVFVMTWCAVWWIFEPVSIPATSLIPFAFFPLFGVLTYKEVAAGYGHHMVLLFIGAFMVARALEKSGAHRQLAIGMVTLVGGVGGRRLVLGFMLANAALSMWVSNTACMLMLLPVALAVLEQVEDKKALAIPLLLGLAYAGSVGGMGTPVGTPPNVIFMGVYEGTAGSYISFLKWMLIALPGIVIMFPLIWMWLTRGMGEAKAVELPKLGPWRTEEIRVLVIFLITALAWVFRKEPFGGWSGLIGDPDNKFIGDSTVALVAALVLFIFPNGHGGRLLNWETAKKIPWGLLLMIGAGMTISNAFQTSGLSEAVGNCLRNLEHWHPLTMIAIITFSSGFLTNLIPNAAMAALLMPLLASVAFAAKIDPAVLMLPAVLATSCSFMLPVGTMPNAIVYGSGYVTVKKMASEGFFVNLFTAVIITLVYYLLLPIFGFSM